MSNENVKLTAAQRVAANKVVANDINKAGIGFAAEVWTQADKGYSGVSVSKDGKKVAMLTINAAGFQKVRSYLRGTDISALAPLGFVPDQYTTIETEYKGGGKKFDLARLNA